MSLIDKAKLLAPLELTAFQWVDKQQLIEAIKTGRFDANSVFQAVIQECLRQDAKWGQQNDDMPYWLGILGEEFGKVCQAVNETVFDNGEAERAKGGYVNMRREAVQVAAVAVQFIEYLDRQYGNGPLKLPDLPPGQFLNYNGEIYTKEQVIALVEKSEFHPTQSLMTVSDAYIHRSFMARRDARERGEEAGDFCESDPDARLVEV